MHYVGFETSKSISARLCPGLHSWESSPDPIDVGRRLVTPIIKNNIPALTINTSNVGPSSLVVSTPQVVC